MSQRSKAIWTLLIILILLTPVGYWFFRRSPERQQTSPVVKAGREITEGSVPPFPDRFDGCEHLFDIRLHVPEGREEDWPEYMEDLQGHVQEICKKHDIAILLIEWWGDWLEAQRSVYLFVALDRGYADPVFPQREWRGILSLFETEPFHDRTQFYIHQTGYRRRPNTKK